MSNAHGVFQSIHAAAVEQNRVDVVEGRATPVAIRAVQDIARQVAVDAERGVVAIRTRIRGVEAPAPATVRTESTVERRRSVPEVDVDIVLRAERHDHLGEVGEAECAAIDHREELAEATRRRLAARVEDLSVPVDVTESEVRRGEQAHPVGGGDDMALIEERRGKRLLTERGGARGRVGGHDATDGITG